jgi:predicted nucleotidyltransferase
MVLPALDTATGIRVDFIFSFTPYEKGAIARSRKVSIGGEDVAFATAEDLIIHKIFAGRPRDLEDVRSVLLRNPSQDLDYIRQWLREFDAGEEGRGFPATFEEILESVSSI